MKGGSARDGRDKRGWEGGWWWAGLCKCRGGGDGSDKCVGLRAGGGGGLGAAGQQREQRPQVV
jgi:hypothetical protein